MLFARTQKSLRVGDRWRFAAVVEKNGRIVRDPVWISGRDEHHPDGRYYSEWYQSGRRCRQSVSDFQQLTEAARRKSIECTALEAGAIEPGKGQDRGPCNHGCGRR